MSAMSELDAELRAAGIDPATVDFGPAGSATAGNNLAVHIIRYALPGVFVTMCGTRTPRRPQTTQAQLSRCARCFR